MKHLKYICAAAVAAIVGIFAMGTPSIAATTQHIRGVNWADGSGNNKTGVLYLCGMYPNTTTSQAYSMGQTMGSAVLAIKGTAVRIPVNPATVSSSYWSVYQNAINGVLNKGLIVDLCYWTETTGGTIYNTTTWDQMWSTINGVYGSNTKVLFEPINEPFSYSAPDLALIYESFISKYKPAKWKCLFDGTGYATYLNGIATDKNLDNQYFAIHVYQNWDNVANNENWQDYLTVLNSAVDGYESQTVITEMGVNTADGTNYYDQTSDGLLAEVEYLTGVTHFMRINSMGSFDWSGILDGNSYRWWSASTDLLNGESFYENYSVIKQFQWGWGQRQ